MVLDILYGMPTLKRIGGLRVVIYPNDHRPAHVHVIGNGCEAVFRLNCSAGSVELRENFGFPMQALGGIVVTLAADLTYLCNEWGKIHGHA
jgi:hypothetical protein